MNTAKVKANKPSGCCKGFGTFELTYPNNLYGVMEPSEFETTIRTLNQKCETKMPRKYFAFFIPTLVGLILLIAGFYKIANEQNLNTDGGYEKTKNGSILVGIGISLTIVSCLIFGIAMCIFQNSVNKKIKTELDVINDHFSSRRIRFTLESEIIEELVDPHEYDVHKNNTAYRNSITYDIHGRPIRKVTVYYILITFPAASNPNSGYSNFNISNNNFSMNV